MSSLQFARQLIVPSVASLALIASAASWAHRQEAGAVSPSPAARDLSSAFREVAAKVTPSIVSIETMTKSREVSSESFDEEEFPFKEFFKNDPRLEELFRNAPNGRRRMTPRRQGVGSGFVIDSTGVIMTNSHVVSGADVVKVRLTDGREFTATDVKTDPRTDVAIVRIEGAGDLPAIKLGDSAQAQVGDWVLAIGSPFGLETSVTAGIISAVGRSRGIADRESFLQTDAAINPGNSGGPLLNLDGEVIGINTAIASQSGGYDGIGFAIPTQIAGWVGKQLVDNGSVRRGYLGTSIAPLDARMAEQLGTTQRSGAVVTRVLPKSPAKKSGLEAGDVILELNQTAIRNPVELQATVEQLEIGKEYPLEILRDGNKQTLQVTIEEMPKDFSLASVEPESEETPATELDSLGISIDLLTADVAKQLNLQANGGVLVTDVKSGSAASAAGLKVGDVIERVSNRPVTSPQQCAELLKDAPLADGVVLHVSNASGRRLVIVRVES